MNGKSLLVLAFVFSLGAQTCAQSAQGDDILTVYRGIDRIAIDRMYLDHRCHERRFGNHVFTSVDPTVAIRYSNPTSWGAENACDALVLKMQIPLAAFVSSDQMQSVIDGNSPHANLARYIREVGFHRRDDQPAADPQERLDNLEWRPFVEIWNRHTQRFDTPAGCTPNPGPTRAEIRSRRECLRRLSRRSTH